ncbi:hypothetical protein L6164_015615 [Bauhinia variegata]|uniref:Uncharacterized protein n=1 Tax=Bauhinia variegata TaxID=167791 RepID=A0ACB9NKT5_BAUVA|nr:hypothetical protein L6164_015615 [Bauhinia variegata]
MSGSLVTAKLEQWDVVRRRCRGRLRLQQEKNHEKLRMSGGERSAYFSRRETAKVLRTIIQGDAKRQAVASIKSLISRLSIGNKKGTFALVCQTLKHISVLRVNTLKLDVDPGLLEQGIVGSGCLSSFRKQNHPPSRSYEEKG